MQDDYVRLRLAVANNLMADMQSSMTDDPNYWERTGIKPTSFLTALVRICEDDRVFDQARDETEHIRAFMAEFTRFNEADQKRRYEQWGLEKPAIQALPKTEPIENETTNNSISFDWRMKYLEAGYERAAREQKKGQPPDKEAYRGWAASYWGGFIQEALAHFYAGVQWFMVPWPPEDDDDLAAWEDEWFDPSGRPISFYDEEFADSLCELATKYGEFTDVYTAKLYLGLADRYIKRGEWVLGVLRSMFFELPDLPAAMIDAYYAMRCGLPPGEKPVISDGRVFNPQLALF